MGARTAKMALIADTLSAVPIWAVTPLVRPWHMHWGATRAEVAAPMPGDDIVRRAQFNATRAITIQAPPRAGLAVDRTSRLPPGRLLHLRPRR